jgi:hypothetical protein
MLSVRGIPAPWQVGSMHLSAIVTCLVLSFSHLVFTRLSHVGEVVEPGGMPEVLWTRIGRPNVAAACPNRSGTKMRVVYRYKSTKIVPEMSEAKRD